ncbi:HAD family hydrolase [Vibrio aquimaris]|uniref:dUMP phosphatase n=1 Tax=Vibrio aquimaris TaxID=2587862 RepID=A0A5P9CJ00_9VIBR|nr:HAD family hydrolase [Vibrio aquimaris]QFT26319.1 dUMP phosphatase [Vibrio aquimaris]
MVDLPEENGKMCDWVDVQAVTGAEKALEHLSKSHKIYVATNAADSSEMDVKSAFERVGLSEYISGYFCKANLGIGKGTPEFFHRILNILDVESQSIFMVGDTYDKDIVPAIKAGIQAIWFNPNNLSSQSNHTVKTIESLSELYTPQKSKK